MHMYMHSTHLYHNALIYTPLNIAHIVYLVYVWNSFYSVLYDLCCYVHVCAPVSTIVRRCLVGIYRHPP